MRFYFDGRAGELDVGRETKPGVRRLGGFDLNNRVNIIPITGRNSAGGEAGFWRKESTD